MEEVAENYGLTPEEKRGVLRGVHTFLRNRVHWQRKHLGHLREYARLGYIEPGESEIPDTEAKLSWAQADYKRISERMEQLDGYAADTVLAAERLREKGLQA